MTTDMWTSITKQGYVAITTHSVGNSWVMRHLIIRSMRKMFPYTAERLLKNICETLRKINLLKKSWTFILDNTSTNSAMTSILKNWLNDNRTLPLSNDWPIHCITHVFQLSINYARISVLKLDETIGYLRDISKTFVHMPNYLRTFSRYDLILVWNTWH